IAYPNENSMMSAIIEDSCAAIGACDRVAGIVFGDETVVNDKLADTIQIKQDSSEESRFNRGRVRLRLRERLSSEFVYAEKVTTSKPKMATIRRLNTIKVQFDGNATRPMAMDVHLWIQQTLNLNTEQVDMLQLNTQEKSLYIKVISPTIYEKLIHKHEGTTDFKYNNGEQTQVKVSKADVPSVTVRVFKLPPEVPSSLIQTALNTYGVVHSVRQEQWSTAYPFPVNNGVRAVKMEIKKHIPGSISIAGYNAHITYVGQPILCYVCHEPNHKKEDCPQRKTTMNVNVKQRQLLLSDIVSGTVIQQREAPRDVQTMERPTEREAPVEEETDTASEIEAIKTVTTEDEQNIMDTTEYTANDAAEVAQDKEQLTVINDDIEITNTSSGMKKHSDLGILENPQLIAKKTKN
ncbi:hypothetical protein ANN_06615, partial [Periplaneta americana]